MALGSGTVPAERASKIRKRKAWPGARRRGPDGGKKAESMERANANSAGSELRGAEASARIVLEARELRKSYGQGAQELRILSGVNLVLREGEMVAIVAPSGAGKSTLLHLLAALDTPSNGAVYFDLKAIETKDEAALAALEEFSSLYAQSPDLRNAFANPSIPPERRVALLHEVLAGEDMPDAVRHFLYLLLRRGRIAVVHDVAEVFSGLVDKRLDRIRAQVRTAAPLDDAHRLRIAQALQNYFKKTIRMKCAVDPSLLGGVVAHAGGVMLDGSIRTRLERLKAALLSKEL